MRSIHTARRAPGAVATGWAAVGATPEAVSVEVWAALVVRVVGGLVWGTAAGVPALGPEEWVEVRVVGVRVVGTVGAAEDRVVAATEEAEVVGEAAPVAARWVVERAACRSSTTWSSDP